MKKIDEMMDHYRWADETVVPKEPLTGEEKARILNLTLKKAGLSKPHSMPRPARNPMPRRKMWTIAAACILVLAMGTVSFASIALDKNFLDFFAPKNQGHIDGLNSIGVIIDKQVTDNGLTVDVREAVGDDNAVYVLFDIIAPEGTVLDQSYYAFQTAFVDLPGRSGSAGYYFQQLPDADSKDNRLSMMLCYSAETNLSGRTMRLQFADLSVLKSAEEMAIVKALPPRSEPGTPGDAYDSSKVLIAGVWEVEFPLNYPDSSATIKPNADVELFGGLCKIKEIRYSAISATVIVKGDSIAKYDEKPSVTQSLDSPLGDNTLGEAAGDPKWDETPQAMQVLLKDGSTVQFSSFNQSINRNKLTTTCQFSEIIDPANILSITYGGTTIPIS